MRFYLFFFLLGYNLLQAQPTILPPPQTDEIIIDNGAAGKADPNDRIRYKVTIQNNGTIGATGTQLNIVPDPRTTFVPGTFRSSPLALPDSYTSTGNVGITIPAASGLKANDFDDNIPGLTITAGTFATTQGGSIMISADGSFMYTPPAGFTGSDTYTYTLNDANGVGGVVPTTDMAIVTITVSNLIWFIDNSSVAATSDGRLTSPFKSLADFNAGSTVVGDLTYIEHTGTNYTGGIVLQDNERVYGEGHTGAANLSGVLPFTLAPNSKTLPNINGTRPILINSGGDGVTLAMNNNLRGFDVGNCSDFGMDNSGTNSIGNLIVSEVAITNTTGGGFDASNGSGASMNAVFSSISSIGGVNGINLTNCAGTFTVNGGTITNPTGTGVLISGGSVVFNSSGAISDNSGFAIDVDNHDSGNVTFSGSITSTGTGIRVQNCGGGTKTFSGSSKSLTTTTNNAISLLSNTGGTVTFSNGGLVISTTSGVGFNATGGAAAINVTGSGNTITSGTGTALNIANTTIGVSGITFQSISSNGSANGIVLNNTGTNSGLSVTGTGGGTNNGSGGTIQNTTGSGVSLTTTINVSLNYMNIQNSGDDGISGTTVTGFSMIRSNVTNNGNALNEDGVDFGGSGVISPNGLYGTVTITNSVFTGNYYNQFTIRNSSNTATMTMTGCTITGRIAENNNNDGLFYEALGTAIISGNIQTSSFSGNKGDHFQAAATNTGDLNIIFKSNTLTGGHSSALGQGITINAALGVAFGGYAGNVTYDIDGNNINGAISNGVTIAQGTSSSDATFDGFVRNNIIGTSNMSLTGSTQANGVYIDSRGNGTHTSSVTNNTIRQCFDRGILLEAGDGSPTVHLTIQDNIIDQQVDPNAREAIQTNFGITSTNVFGVIDAPTVCLQLGGAGALDNNFSHGAGAPDDFRLRKRFGATVRLPGYAGGTGQDATSLAQVVVFIQGQNTGSAGEPGSASASGTGGGYTGGAVCDLP